MGGKQVETRLKNSRDSWKNKTRIKSLELKRQQKRILELEESRDKWKANYQRLKKSGTLSIRQGEKIARHSYDSGVIWLCVWLQMIGKLSFRGVVM